ncbi:unnamed protein product [Moneuplotes crassus]|uniref:CSC1/OSCA1-like cytosolic domain-containing protein n=1 Tax=Euplotes crassus TaxID=5936 RepID=A0AAD1UPF6_EUPCR|nr:unnamed protein product [Moneuplotes crassus]
MSTSKEDHKSKFEASISSTPSESLEPQLLDTHTLAFINRTNSKYLTPDFLKQKERILNKIPPNKEIAEYHGLVSRVFLTAEDTAKLRETQSLLRTKTESIVLPDGKECPCCKHKLIKDVKELQRFSFWTSAETFRIFGTGVPMYFYFMIFLIILLFLISMIVSIPTITLNIIEDNKDELGVRSPSFLVYTSIGNHGITSSGFNKSSSINTIIILNMIGTFIIFLGYRIYRCMSLRFASRIDEETITPSDFTVFATNIDRDTTKEDIIQYLQREHQAEGINNVILCYDIEKPVKILRKKFRKRRAEQMKIQTLKANYKRMHKERLIEEGKEIKDSENLSNDDDSLNTIDVQVVENANT